MSDMMRSRTISVSIARPADEVYDFVSRAENLPRWAVNFARAVRKEANDWVVETPDGEARVEFAPRNAFGVADHRVRVGSGPEILVPMRVIPNGRGADVVFTLFMTPAMTEEAFAGDAKLVEGDLLRLRNVLERPAP